jgi:gamma-glutamyl-gamma-aminobutyrate hydrolase PuuD
MANERKRVFIVDTDALYTRMFLKREWEIVDSIYDADLVQFTGGEDVSPSLYGVARHPQTFDNPARDKREQEIWELAQELGLPVAGICRGGQFINVMNGGKMWQHVDNHGISGGHIANLAGPIGHVVVSSTHHQMMIPAETGEKVILLTANESTLKETMHDKLLVRRHVNKDHPDDDVEAIYYPETNSLCFQPHPEYTGFGPCQEVYFYFINNYLMSGGLTANEVETDLYINVLGDTVPF